MDKLAKGSCAQYSANEPESFYRSIQFWKTPVADCGNGQKNCMDLRRGQRLDEDQGLMAIGNSREPMAPRRGAGRPSGHDP